MKALRVGAALAIAALLWVTLAAWALSSPVYSSPDDNYHLPMIYCTAGEAECSSEGKRVDVCYAFQPDSPADCANGGASTPPTQGIRPGWYPPLYYQITSLLTGATVAETSVTLRLFNSAVVVCLALGSVLLSRPNLRPAVTMSWLVCTFPLAAFLFASINPHAWTIAGLAALWGPLVSFLVAAQSSENVRGAFGTSTGRWLHIGQLIFIQTCALLALGSRSESPVFLSMIAISLSVFALRWPLARTTRGGLVGLLITALLVVESIVTFVLVVPDRLAFEAPPAEVAVYSPWLIALSVFQLPLQAITSPELGWLDTPIPALAQALSAGAFFAAMIVGLRVLYPRKTASLGLLFVGAVLFIAYLLSQASSAYRYQPRYFLPLLFVLVGIALLPKTWAPRSRTGVPTRAQWAAITVAVVAVNSLALLSNTTRYVLGLGSGPESTISPGALSQAEPPAWWWNSVPFSPWQIWVMGSLAFAAAALLMLMWVVQPSSSQTPRHSPRQGEGARHIA